MAIKYKQTYRDMVTQHKTLFDKFREIHDKFQENPDENKDEFNNVGMEVMETIRRFEVQLTSHMTGSGYGKFSTNVTDKFWAEIKKNFPKIEFVGVK